MNRSDLTGRRFGRLVVCAYDKSDKNGHVFWKCKCDCGKETTVRGDLLKRRKTTSCGCVASEVTAARSLKHGKSSDRLYRIWNTMRTRCTNPNHPGYARYGAQGITCCEEWIASFEPFFKWAKENGYEDNLTLDRINNSKGYSPDNCRWVDCKKQANNRTNNRIIVYEGIKYTVAELSEKLGVTYKSIYISLKKGALEEYFDS